MSNGDKCSLVDEFFMQHPNEPGQPAIYTCWLCAGNEMKDYRRHMKLANHQSRVAEYHRSLRDVHSNEAINIISQGEMNVLEGDERYQALIHSPKMEDDIDLESIASEDSDGSDEVEAEDDQSEADNAWGEDISLNEMSDEDSSDDGAGYNPETNADPNIRSVWIKMLGAWFPLTKKEDAIAVVSLGGARTRTSQEQYRAIRMGYEFLKTKLPNWNTLSSLQQRMKELMGLKVYNFVSPLGKQCSTLSIAERLALNLANPKVAEHVQFYPQVCSDGLVQEFRHGDKWLSGLEIDLRAPMVHTCHGHFYLYEPLLLKNGRVVAPTHFYHFDEILTAKVLPVEMKEFPNSSCFIRIPQEQDLRDMESFSVENFLVPFDKMTTSNGLLLQKNCGGCIYQQNHVTQQQKVILVPNAWRVKAQGRVIRHVPLTLYCDDTSGNISKQWNKHISYYINMSGLPSHLIHLDFNTLFLATSNTASALELGDHVVDQLNTLSSQGAHAYNASMNQEVMIMAIPLCFVGDSPMHAEISNTCNPASTLTPCRMCPLSASSMADKKTARYIQQFLGISSGGVRTSVSARCWNDTIVKTHQLWHMSRQPGMFQRVEDMGKAFGIKDGTNQAFIDCLKDCHRQNPHYPQAPRQLAEFWDHKYGHRLFNPFLRLRGFDGHKDTPVEALHVVLLGATKYLYRDCIAKLSDKQKDEVETRWKYFKTTGLGQDHVQARRMVVHAQSLNGKEFRMVLQGALFVFGRLISPLYRAVWCHLGHVATMVYQHEIRNMDEYCTELDDTIESFLMCVTKLTAQWLNKPKFHMFKHFTQCIRRFGPASLFAAESFERQNGVTCKYSIHSNQHNPTFDIANTANSYHALKHILSAGLIRHPTRHEWLPPGPRIIDFFVNNHRLCSALGYKAFHEEFSQDISKNRPEAPGGPSAQEVANDNCYHLKQETGMLLPSGQVACDTNFVSLKYHGGDGIIRVGQVIDMWTATPRNGSKKQLLRVYKCVLSPTYNSFYGMREFQVIQDIRWFYVSEAVCLINAQHNCAQAECSIHKAIKNYMEDHIIARAERTLVHKDHSSYIVNASSLYYGEVHRHLGLPRITVASPTERIQTISEGLAIWKSAAAASKRTAGPVQRGDLGDYQGHTHFNQYNPYRQ
ncbi:hypothetical protein DFH28DRAFT_279386 [Melampsora americana]|nr:hypothetical protein DFH28DRAFT_279386 [Melampsora americana]